MGAEMTRPKMMNYTIKSDNEELRDRILSRAETNIKVPWVVTISPSSPNGDPEGKWGLFIDGGTVSTKKKLLSAIKGESFCVSESGESSV
jgi:hypothetical protein